LARSGRTAGRRRYAAVRRSAGFRPSRARICPTCLAEGHRPRPAWDCRLLVACTRHGLRLVDRCPDCARSLSWDRPSAGRC
ncbi:TniQ family protein, partial [Escherichia coli]|uniref:TniQ family protein n=1 Tax=Escherichia coli TaxID=562 RepID=UPI00193263C9|nr:TniQ family protein [Escherichia coli]